MSGQENPTVTDGSQNPPTAFWDVYHRKAKVVIRNNTSVDLVGASIMHKYSNVYSNKGAWGIIKPGECSSPLEVDYNTGDLTTGRDWWLLQFATGEWFCYTDPKNFRSIVDFLEGQAPQIVGELVGLAVRVAAARKGKMPDENIDELAKSAKELTESLVKLVTNDESTVGFKQHILRDDDKDDTTEIIVNPDWTVKFHSNSGNSETNLAWKKKA